jgi:perosamine synthetase
MGLAALGVGPGDEVILADTNWVASMAPILYLGARPVFVDIEPRSWCLCPEAVEAAVTPRTKAIVAVHLYGNLCAMDELLRIGAQHGIPVIEDAAEALGATYRESYAGSMGVFGVFSFHGSKTMTTGEGGMWVGDDDALYEKVLSLSNHGRVRGQQRQFWPEMLGYKYKMSNLQAALGCAQLSRAEELVGRKREILFAYSQALSDLAGVTLNQELPDTRIGAWMPTVAWSSELPLSSQALLLSFAASSIDARPVFAPLSTLPFVGGTRPATHAAAFYENAVNLPSFHDMTTEDIQRVSAVVRDAIPRK